MANQIVLPGVDKQRMIEQVRAAGLDGMLLSSAENVYYASGLPTLPDNGNPILFAHNLPPSSLIHTFYLLKWLFGGVIDIQAIAYKLIPESKVDDHVLAFGHLANGAVFATTQSCVTEAPWSECLEIHGSKGSLIVDQLANPPAIYFHGTDDIDGTPLPEVPFDPLAWKYFSVVAEVQGFVHAVREERDPTINPLYGHHALRVVEAACRSVAEEKAIAL